MYKRYKSSPSYYNYQKYLEKRNETKRQIRKAVKEYEHKISKESKHYSKSFCKYVNSKLKRNTGINNLIKPDGTFTKSDDEKATKRS